MRSSTNHFHNLEACWRRFNDYLKNRTPSHPEVQITVQGPELTATIDRWIGIGISRLRDPNNHDPDAEQFRAFDRDKNVLNEAWGLVETLGER